MIRNILCFAALCMLSLTQAASQSWTSLNGPWRVGNGKDIAVGYASSTRVLYLADSASNLKKSTDGGGSWNATSTAVNNSLVVACKPGGADTLVVATSGGIKNSLDGGANFSTALTVSNLFPRRFAVSSSNSANMLLGTAWPQSGSPHATLYKSTSGGQDWDQDYTFVNDVHTNLLGVAFHPSDANKMLVGGSAVPVVAGSAPSPTTKETYYSLEFAMNMDLETGVWYSTNGGENWDPIASGDLVGKSISAVAITTVSGGATTFFAGTADLNDSDGGQLWKSTNGGSTWTQVFDRGQGSVTSIAVMSTNSSSNRIYVGHNRLGMSYSFDNGANWYHDNSTTAHDAMFDWDVIGIAVHPSDANDAFVVSRSSAFFGSRSSAGLINWQDKNTNIASVPISAVSASSSTVLAVAPTFTGIARYTPAGGWQSWRAVTTVLNKLVLPEAVAFDPYITTKAAVGGRTHPSSSNSTYDAVIYFNRDGGASNWKEAFQTSHSATDYNINAFVADPKEQVRRYALGKMKGSNGSTNIESNIMVSLNNDSTWLLQSKIANESNAALCMVIDSTGGGTSTSQILYASVSGKGVYKSTDAGTNWTSSFVSSYTIRSLALNTTSPSTIHAGGDVSGGNGLWKSTNSGSSWSGKRSDACPRVIMHPYLSNVGKSCMGDW